MSKFQLQNLAGETLGEYARKEAALKAADASGFAEGDFIVLDPNGVQVHPAPEGATEEAPAEAAEEKPAKPKPAKKTAASKAKPAKEKTERAKPLPPAIVKVGDTHMVRRRNGWVDVIEGEAKSDKVKSEKKVFCVRLADVANVTKATMGEPARTYTPLVLDGKEIAWLRNGEKKADAVKVLKQGMATIATL